MRTSSTVPNTVVRARVPRGGAQGAKGAPAKGKATKRAEAPKSASQAKKVAKAPRSAGPREGSKTDQVVAMLQRKNGATLNMIRKGRVKWLTKRDVVGQGLFVDALFGLTAA
jgi:hypothetical protein